MSNTAIEFLNRQNEELTDLIMKHRVQLDIIKSWNVRPPNVEKVLENNLLKMLQQQIKIQEGLSMLNGDETYEEQFFVLTAVSNTYMETVH